MRFFLAALTLTLASAQPDRSREAMLAGIRTKMQENLARLPDYTCRLTIERSTRRAGERRYRPLDVIHLEVGLVDGAELYAWPGQKFQSRRLDEMMPSGGAVGTGDFAMHVHSIFEGNAATFRYAGGGVENGREITRFEYSVPQEKSRYLLQDGHASAFVGYHGSFSADARTLQLLGLEIAVDEVPREVNIRRAGSRLTYGLVNIGGREFLLPRVSDLFIVDNAGEEARNVTRFDNCRQYQGESVVSFAEPEASPQARRTVTEIRLPAGVRVEMTLGTTLDGARAVIGDEVTARVSKDVKAGGTIIPKGATVIGRVTRIYQITNGRVPYQVIGLRMSEIEFAECHAEFEAALESMEVASQQVTVGSGKGRLERGESVVFVKGNVLRIPAGVHMFWRTL